MALDCGADPHDQPSGCIGSDVSLAHPPPAQLTSHAGNPLTVAGFPGQLAWPTLPPVEINSEHSQFSSRPARARPVKTPLQRMIIIGVIRMQQEIPSVNLQRHERITHSRL
jgi:hypothetical protein